MEYQNLVPTAGLFDAGDKAPTFNFKLSDFGFKVSENADVWTAVKQYYAGKGKVFATDDQLQDQLLRDRAAIIQETAFREFMKLHAREYPEEADDIQIIRLRCSSRFEVKAEGSTDSRKPWQIGNAHDIEHVIAQIEFQADTRIVFATPSAALNFGVTTVLKNIFRRVHDTGRADMLGAVTAYRGTGLTTPFSLRFWHTRHVQGVEPTTADFKAQMLRHPDYFKSEILQVILQALTSSNIDPTLLTLLIAQEYQKSKVWFDENHYNELTQELEE